MTTLDERAARIAAPGEAAYTAATRVFNLASPLSPAAAVTVRDVEDVRAVLAHAHAVGRPVRVIGTGHASAAEAPMDGALLVRTEIAGAVEVDTARRVARIPAGTPWKAVVAATVPYGLIPPHGSAGTVGAVGYLLRGGVSLYGRAAGLAINSVRAIELVTADGTPHRVDGDHDPELFWALRGGGGGFGVVTAIEVALFPAATVVTGAAFWRGEHAAALLSTWLDWARSAPRAVTGTLRLFNLPDVPEVPSVLKGGTVLCADGVVLAEPGADPAVAQNQADALLTPLRGIADPVLDTWQRTEPAAVLATHMDPEDPVPARGDHLLLRDLDPAGAAEFLRLLGAESDSPLVLAGLRQLGGALAQGDPAGGALDHLDADLLYSAAGIPVDAAAVAAIDARLAAVRAALGPWDTGRTAPSFVESPTQPQGHLDAGQIERADRVRATVDPTGMFAGDITPGATASQ